MLSTSGTFNFQSIQIELIIREAFEKIGISGEFVEPVKLESAKRSIDLIFLEWMNKSVNLWTLEKAYLPLVPLQGQYVLDVSVSNIIQANLRASSRQVTSSGVAASSSGVAANAFDGNPATSCAQIAADGNISYDYGLGVTKQINFVGITSHTSQQYTISIEISQDNATWVSLFDIPKQTYAAGVNVWFDVPTSVNGRAYRIRETGGATLNIREIYFNNNVEDLPISNISRDDYYSYPNKYEASRPSVFYLDRQILPVLTLWPLPTADYNCLQYSYKKMIQDTGMLYTNGVQIPSRFYPALIWRLAWELAIKFNPEKIQILGMQAEMSFEIAAKEDSEMTPLNIYADTSCYYE
jgi:hypothetical protein